MGYYSNVGLALSKKGGEGLPLGQSLLHGFGAHHQLRGAAGGLIRGILPGGVENRENVDAIFTTGVNEGIIGVDYKLPCSCNPAYSALLRKTA